MAFKFENLRVWQMALDLSKAIDELSFSFPKREEYVLSPQIRRDADSIALNIAEGSTGQSTADFKRFLGMSLRSAIEVIGCLHLGKKRNIISDENFNIFMKNSQHLLNHYKHLEIH